MFEKFGNTENGCLFALLLVAAAVPLFFLTAWIIMLLWNWLIPNLFNASELTYWETVGLSLLCSILFNRLNINIK